MLEEHRTLSKQPQMPQSQRTAPLSLQKDSRSNSCSATWAHMSLLPSTLPDLPTSAASFASLGT